jgi:hypothetical protein
MNKQEKNKLVRKKVSDFNHKINPNQLREGIDVEKEHSGGVSKSTDVLRGNKEKIAKIAVAHLKEDPKYYTHLNAMEKKYKK